MSERFVPRAQSPIVQGSQVPIDPTWHRFLRQLGVDLDADEAAITAHAALWPAHGWTRVADKALTVGKNTVAHGLGQAPVGVLPYYSDASGLAGTWMTAIKNGDLALSSANAWNDVTGWGPETDTYSCFDATTGVWTCPRTGVYHLDFLSLAETLADADFASSRLLCSDGYAHGTSVMVGGVSVGRLAISWTKTFTAGQTVKPQTYRNTGALTFKATTGDQIARVSVRSVDEVNAYAWDATNLYVHSSYEHTRSFLVR